MKSTMVEEVERRVIDFPWRTVMVFGQECDSSG